MKLAPSSSSSSSPCVLFGAFITFICILSGFYLLSRDQSQKALSFPTIDAKFGLYHDVLKRSLNANKLKVIKTYRDRAVYVLDTNNTRHVIPDWSTFLSLGYDQKEIVTITDEEMAAIPEGSALDPIVEEQLPQNPNSQCPCFANSQYVSFLKNLTIHKAQYHVCFVNNSLLHDYSAEFATLFNFDPHQNHPGGGANHLKYSIVSDRFTEKHYRSMEKLSKEIELCDLIIELIHELNYYKYECPEKCIPVPYTKLPIQWFEERTPEIINQNIPVTCSMTWEDLLSEGTELSQHRKKGGGKRQLREGDEATSGRRNRFSHSGVDHHHYLSITLMLKLIIERRLEECHEKDEWRRLTGSLFKSGGGGDHKEVSKDYHEIGLESSLKRRREVFGMIIWVGSRSRYWLLEEQIQVLRQQNLSNPKSISPEEVIVGWMASEDQYDCRPGTTICSEVSSSNSYYHYMPSTRLNVASAGWACAQRRPLRAISHTLLLYDPYFLLVVDDDTWVNMWMLLQTKFKAYVMDTLTKERLVLGQLTQGRKVTRKGFYYGGSGYLIGSLSIQDLTAYSIKNPREPMTRMIDPTQMAGLSLYNQILPMAKDHCPACMTPPPDSKPDELGVSAKLSVRMIDICLNVMSQEHTCYHSDHALSRCFIHGIYASPLDVACQGSLISSSGLYFGMCMGIDGCNSGVQLTCHRWKPGPDDPLKPVDIFKPVDVNTTSSEDTKNSTLTT